MPQLEELRINHCNQLEQIIVDEEHQNITNSHIESCSRSTSDSSKLHSGSGTILLCGICRTRSSGRLGRPTSGGSVDAPQATGGSLNFCSLKRLMVQSCPMLKSLFTLSIVRILTSLEGLKISTCHELKEIITCERSYGRNKEESCFQSHVSLFPNLKNVDIEDCGSLGCIFPVSFTRGLTKLEFISICRTPQLKFLFPQFIAKVLTSLKILMIEECHGLKEIITCESAHECKSQKINQNDGGKENHVSLLFPRLEEVSIENCNSLEYTLPVSFIQGLPKLRFISILKAPQLQYLFCEGNLEYTSSHQYQNMIQIKLPLLKNFYLEYLPNLISICPRNCYAECPSLQEIRLELNGLSNSTAINRVRAEDKQWDYCPTKDLGVTTRKPVQGSTTLENSNPEDKFSGRKKDLLLTSDKVTSRYEMVLSCRSASRYEMVLSCISAKCLQNLHQLKVEGCGKLRALFSVSVLGSLPHLKELIIIECEELEQITVEDEENEDISSSCSQNLCFPQLEVLIIKGCNKLKRLFSMSTSHEFPKLESIMIIEASQLKEVFEGGKGKTEYQREVALPELKYLMLVQLPSLATSACQGVKIPNGTNYIVGNFKNFSSTAASPKSIEEFGHDKKASHIEWDVYVGSRDEFCKRVLQWRVPPSQITEETCKGITGETKITTEISQRISTSSDQSVMEAQQGLPIKNSNTITSSNDLESQVLVKKDSQSKPMSVEQEEIREREITNDTPCSPFDPENFDIEPENNSSPKAASKKIAMENSSIVPKFEKPSLASLKGTSSLTIGSAEPGPTLGEAAIASISNDLAEGNAPPAGSSIIDTLTIKGKGNVGNESASCTLAAATSSTIVHGWMDEKSISKPTLLGQQLAVVEMKQITGLFQEISISSDQGVTKEEQEDLPINKANAMTSLHKSSPQVLEKKDSTTKPLSMDQLTIGDGEVTNDAPNIPSDLAKNVTEPENNIAPKGTLEETAMETSVSKWRSSSIYQSGSSSNRISSQGVVDGVQEGLAIEKAKAIASSSHIILMEQQSNEANEITDDCTNSLLDPAQTEPKFKTVTSAKPITSQEVRHVVSDANSPEKVLATHDKLEVIKLVSNQPQQIISPPPVLSAASTSPDTISSYQPQSVTMSLSSGQTFEELIHISRPVPTLHAPGSIPNLELDPVDELESLLGSPTKRLPIPKMAEDLDALFDKVVDELYNDPAILERLAQISSISESMTESDAPLTFVDFMKNFRTKYPQLLMDFHNNKKAVLEYEKAKTEEENIAAQIPTIKDKKKELEDNIRRAEFADQTFSDQIKKLKEQLGEVESQAQAHKVVLSSLHQERSEMNLNTRTLVKKAKKINQFIGSNSSAYAENRANLTSLRNVWTDLKSQFVQSRRGL